jgi:uncharacterized protein YbaR (Trm112 family)
MLPTNEKVINTKEYQLLLSASLFWTSKIEIERYTEGWFFLNNSSNHNSCAITIPNVELFKHQHLYIISDDKIEEDDYYIIDGIPELLKNNGLKFIDDYCKKVIATTDTSLRFPRKNSHPNSVWKLDGALLPQPSQQFIQKFVEEYNKGNIITDVLVEYEKGLNKPLHESLRDSSPLDFERLKVNPEDNTITIKKVKDSYTREEVDRLLDEQASKTTAEMLEKFKGYKSKDDVIDLIVRAVSESHDWSNENNDIHSIGLIEKRFLNKWIEENL